MKKIIYIFILLILTSCNISNENCINNDFVFISSLNYDTIINTCNYNTKLKERIYYENSFVPEGFYYLSNISTDLGINFLDFLKKDNPNFKIGEVEKIELYYILKNLYNYSESYIENEIGIKIEDKYKKYNLNLHRLILSENLLVWGFDEEGKTNNHITNDEIIYLKNIFELDITRYDRVNLVSSDREIYKYLDKKGKELYIEMLEIILNKTKDNTTISLIGDYLKDFN